MSRTPSRHRQRPLPREWEPYIAADPLIAEMDRQHRRDGYKRAKSIRGSFRNGRILTLRFTWRKAIDQVRLEVTHIVQLDIGTRAEEATP
jgi:hypothetical protein